MDEIGSGSCSMMAFGINSIKVLEITTRKKFLITYGVRYYILFAS